MSRTRIIVFSALLTLAGSSAVLTPPPPARAVASPGTDVALTRLEGEGVWDMLKCGACIGGLAGTSFFYPGIPYLFDDDGNVYGACLGACAGILG